MAIEFVDYFWGEKYNGFDVLYHNMKYGQLSSKELSEFFQERSSMEEANWKVLSKVAKQTTSCCGLGTFAPLWVVLRTSAEKLSNLHFQMFQKMTDLVKEVVKYSEDLHKKHRTVKDEEASTLEVVRMMHSTTASLQKAKDAFGARSLELEKLKKDNASPKDIEKAEAKAKKAHEDYRNLVEKYNLTKDEFEKRMSVTCKHFQDVEETHLRQMKEFLTAYCEALEWNHDQVGKVHIEFKRRCVELTVDKLLEQFVMSKYTGLEKPLAVEMEEALAPATPAPLVPITASPDSSENKDGKTTTRESYPLKIEGFLRSRREKRKAKNAATKKKKENSVDSTSNKEEKSDGEEPKGSPKAEPSEGSRELDEDGYSVKPKVLNDWTAEKRRFYSSSDSDSDDDNARKIKVEIKPLAGAAPLSASVDELRATVEGMALTSPITTAIRRGSDADRMKRSQSVSQQIGKSSDVFQSPTVSSASTPTGGTPYAPLNSPPPIPQTEDVFYETPRAGIALPRPPSRRGEPVRGRASPSVTSMSPVEFRTAGVGTGCSRGPSPLTIGMTDTIPLAVAFHEMIHCFFRGSDETRCQVRICGDLMISFPAGIVAVLANHPSPAPLRFKIRDTKRLDNINPNKLLVGAEPYQTTPDSQTYEFNMPALTALLRKQAESNPGASYFNVDILKYTVRTKSGAGSCPFQLVAYWKCGLTHTDLKIDYKYNSHAMAAPSPLLNLMVTVPVDGGVHNCQSKPSATWNEEKKAALWQFTELSQHSEGHGVGSLRARFELSSGPGTQSTIQAQFNCEGTTLSGAELELVGSGYRLSLTKRRFVAGKYLCDGDMDAKYRYASPSSTEC